MASVAARLLSGLIVSCVLATTLPITAASADAAPLHATKRRGKQIWRGYGYLPGYRPPEYIQWQKAHNRGPYWWYGGPQFYRGRWNGGGFGPCWTQTPIGNVWNCGK